MQSNEKSRDALRRLATIKKKRFDAAKDGIPGECLSFSQWRRFCSVGGPDRVRINQSPMLSAAERRFGSAILGFGMEFAR